MSTKKISLLEVLLWLIVVLLILLVLSPFALGFKIKTDYTAMVSNLSNIMQADMQVVGYDRGFFTSNATLELQLPNAPFSLQFKETIIHGPVYLGLFNQGKSPFVAAVVKGELIPAAGFEVETQQLFAGQAPMVYQSIIDYSGNVVSEGYVPPIDALLDQPTGPLAIKSSGMVLKTNYSMQSQEMSGETSLPGFSFSTEEMSINLDNLNMSFAATMGQNGLLMGDSNVSLTKFDVQSNEDQFALHDFRLRTVSSEVGDLVNSFVQLDAREIYASNERFGPAKFNLTLNGLNAASLKQIQDMQNDMQMKVDQGVPPEQVNAMVAGQVIGLVPDLIKQMEMKVDPMLVESELGKLQTTLDFSVEGLDQSAPADPMFMMSAINLDINMAVDEPLMRQFVEWYLSANATKVAAMGDEKARQAEANIPMEQKVAENLQGLLDENWLLMSEGVYTSTISLHQGQMMLNDKAVDPLQQFMSQMSSPAGAATP